MRILILANSRATHTERWSRGLSELGHDIHVVSIRSAEIQGVTVHSRTVGSGLGFVRSLLSYIRLLLSIRRLVKRIDPDVVNAHYSVTHGAIAAITRLRPLVISVWGTDVIATGRGIRATARRLVNGFALRRADLVTSTSTYMIGHVHRAAGRSVPVVRVPFGVDTSIFLPADEPGDDGFKIGFMKHLAARYAPLDLVEAFSRVRAALPGAALVLGGDGPLRATLERRTRELGLVDSVEFLGRVAHERVPALMRGFDVLVNCSRSESFGVAILEASATGIPVVATDVGGVREVLIDGETGFLVLPGDPEAIASALLRLGDDRVSRLRMGRAGRRLVASQYEWDGCVKQMEGVLAQVAMGDSPATNGPGPSSTARDTPK